MEAYARISNAMASRNRPCGISVQRKVVEQLRKDENKSPLDIGREEFIRRAWVWKERYGNTITEQMRRRASVVTGRVARFTMDESLRSRYATYFVRFTSRDGSTAAFA